MVNTTSRIAAAAGLALIIASGARAATIWQNDWLVSSPPTLHGAMIGAGPGRPAQAIAFAADHERVIAAPSPNTIQYHVMRLRPDGSTRWAAAVYEYDHRSSTHALHALPDGGALVALGHGDGEQFGDAILRYAGDGALAWTRKIPTGWLARVSPTRIASAGCSRLTVFDVADGQVTWQRELGKRDACSVGGLVSDADGNLYASIQQTANFALTGYRIAAFDAQGAPRWQVDSDDATGGAVVGLAGTLLLVRGSAELRALQSGDGALAWDASIAGDVHILISRDGTEEALVVGGGTVRRLAADTGMPRWTVAWSGDVAIAEVVDDALLLAGADGSRARLDTSNGAVVWSVTGGGVHWLGFGDLDAGTLQGLAQP
ncbi:MAG TPA: PQQ-binding-like beta-propeller repeat protein, partial [Dokdonella sp.]